MTRERTYGREAFDEFLTTEGAKVDPLSFALVHTHYYKRLVEGFNGPGPSLMPGENHAMSLFDLRDDHDECFKQYLDMKTEVLRRIEEENYYGWFASAWGYTAIFRLVGEGLPNDEADILESYWDEPTRVRDRIRQSGKLGEIVALDLIKNWKSSIQELAEAVEGICGKD
jgi:hypothetical protein